MLQITPAEERHMQALISAAEKQRRELAAEAEARRAAGMVTRAEYLAGSAELRETARLLRAEGCTWQQVADRMGAPSAGAARKLAAR